MRLGLCPAVLNVHPDRCKSKQLRRRDLERDNLALRPDSPHCQTR